MSDNRFSDFSSIGNKKQAPAAATTAQPAEKPARRLGRSSGLIGSSMRTFSRLESNAIITSTIKSWEEAIEINPNRDILHDMLEADDLKFIQLDSEQEETEMSAVLVCRRENKQVVVTAVGLAASASDLGDVYIDKQDREWGARNITVPRTASDIYYDSDNYSNTILRLVKAEYPGCEVHLGGQIVIQASLENHSVEQMKGAFFRAIDSCESLLVDLGVLEAAKFDLKEFIDNEGRIQIKVKMGQVDQPDDLGNTIRSDISLSVMSRVETNDTSNGRPRAKTQEVVVTKGYVDAIITGPVDDTRATRFTEDNCQTLTPLFVITDIDTRREGVSLPQVLTGIKSANILAENNRWAAAWQPQFAAVRKYRFIGSLCRELPKLETPFSYSNITYVGPLKQDATVDYQKVVEMLFHTDREEGGLVTALDIPDGGQISPVLSVIADAAYGDRNAQETVAQAADELFGGENRFSDEWAAQGYPDLFVTDGTRIPLGNFVDENGEVVDIRTIDLAYMERLDVDVDIIDKFHDALNGDTGEPLERLNDLIGIMRSVTPNLNITGYALRVYATPALYELFNLCAKQTGIVLRTDQSLDFRSSQGRGTRAVQRRAVRGQDGLFTSASRRARGSNGRERYVSRRRGR